MSERRTEIEIVAGSVEEAIEKGLSELEVSEEDVDLEILDQGSRGLFGLGSRQARVRLSLRTIMNGAQANARSSAELVETDLEEEPEIIPETTGISEYTRPARDQADSLQDELLRISEEVVQDLLQRMKVRAQVSAHYAEPEDDRSKSPVWVDLHGSDLSILIGPRAETLNALQYIAGLIASKEVGHSIPLIVDVEGFRARRIQQLRQLARRMADQAIKTGHRQVLEPMPASERRIVHIELRNNPQVSTESIGEEPRRKVTIIPK
jgi:spoIIIJ-associated protein